MKILLTGASGFIGSRLLAALTKAGCAVVCVSRNKPMGLPAGASWVGLDFNRAHHALDWAVAVQGVDVVINAVGILRETDAQKFDAIHRAAPCALFKAAAQARVRHIVQVSALGADEEARSRYHLSKKEADDYLLSLEVRATVIQPSLVYGSGGASATMFDTFASMPIIPLPGDGGQKVQPVHIDDLVEAAVALILSDIGPTLRVPMVGPEPLALRDFYAQLRVSLGIEQRPRFVVVPMSIMRIAASFAALLPNALFDRETLAMLERGNTGNATKISSLLGRPPRDVKHFVDPQVGPTATLKARLRWLLPVMRVSIALVWIVTGLVSLGIYPVEESLQLLDRSGVPQWLAPLFLYGAGGLDLVLGILTLWPRRSRWLWVAQAALMLFYTLVITLRLPEFWLHPYGPILKNIPMLAMLWFLYEMEDQRWNT